jgi:Sulfotransferase family
MAPLTRGVPGPYIIGATGGSGTRVVAQVARAGGLYIGVKLNPPADALALAHYSNRWINTFMTLRNSPGTEAAMVDDLKIVLEEHLRTLEPTARAWGWKEPRSSFLLPFFHTHFRDLKFVHVVRDGRDIAYSANQNQLAKHGSVMLAESEAQWPQPFQTIAVWSRLNLSVAAYGEQNLPKQYLRVRFEDLCHQPVEIIRRILQFLDLTGSPEELARREVSSRASLGRWRTHDATTVEALQRVGEEALRKFGYEIV